MKKLVLIICCILFACGTDDDGSNTNTIEVEVSDIADNGATLDWSVPSKVQSGSSVVYKIILSGEVVADNLTSRTYTFTGLNENVNYTGSVFSLDSNGNETFTNFSFTTLQNLVFNGTLILNSQEQIDNFYYTSVEALIIEGEDITDISSLLSLQYVRRYIEINNTSLETLNGLQNIQTDTGSFTFLPALTIDTNNQLQDISQLNSFIEKCVQVNVYDSPSLVNLEGIVIAENSIVNLKNIGISNLSVFNNNIRIERLELEELNNLTSLSGLENIQELLVLNIRDCQNLSSLNGLGTLDRITEFGLINSDLIISLDGLSFLNTNDGIAVVVKDNDNLSDLCAISNWVENNYIISYSEITGPVYIVTDNAYNPTRGEITNMNLCSL